MNFEPSTLNFRIDRARRGRVREVERKERIVYKAAKTRRGNARKMHTRHVHIHTRTQHRHHQTPLQAWRAMNSENEVIAKLHPQYGVNV